MVAQKVLIFHGGGCQMRKWILNVSLEHPVFVPPTVIVIKAGGYTPFSPPPPNP